MRRIMKSSGLAGLAVLTRKRKGRHARPRRVVRVPGAGAGAGAGAAAVSR